MSNLSLPDIQHRDPGTGHTFQQLPQTMQSQVNRFEEDVISQFEVRLARPDEREEVYALRYDVFLAGKSFIPVQGTNSMLDVDQYDEFADHLIVKTEGRIVGTYRAIPTDRLLNAGMNLYASQEFQTSPLLQRIEPSRTVELGRSCVHPSYRNGAIPRLLWSALAKYMVGHGRTDALGCVSVFNASHDEARALQNYFKSQNAWTSDFECPSLEAVENDGREFDPAHLKTLVPPLLRSYLMLGAKILGGPSHDPSFRCHDFLMHFSTTTMSERCRKSLFS